ncbi:unnamed protein product [Effrenium voratum]|nr:unnamed protein product [Effrenium voratum]
MAQLREPEDPSTSSLAVLRAAVYDYQAMRDLARKKLQEKLEEQEKSRVASMELAPLRCDFQSDTDAETLGNLGNRQFHWYRSLLEQVRAQEASNVSKAAHYLLDSVQAVLEQGCEFTSDDFWACVHELEVDDMTPALAALLVSMIRGINGLNIPALIRVLQQQCGDLTPEVLDVLSGH